MKNIVVFSDGTGQKGGEGASTNVYKLFNMVENRTAKQVVFYDSGIGSNGWDKLFILTGRGFSKNILDCYRFIFENYEAGDQIYLFGFSRGAATVRSLSGFIDMFGILPKSRHDLIKKAFKIYRISNDIKRKNIADAFVKKHHTMWARVRFLGVWDTVAALGIPVRFVNDIIDKLPWTKHKFHNYDLSPSVECARHALAVDENRKSFLPVLFANKNLKRYQNLKQIWFAGVHSDVGGGYIEQGLSDIALKWMVEEAIANDLLIYDGHKVEISPNPVGKLHHFKDDINRFLKKQPRNWDGVSYGKANIHYSVKIRADTLDDYNPWILKADGYNMIGGDVGAKADD